jgi:16S rRNA C967 or C1407 C5-methylase (RsmB/RsmF family)
MKNTLPSELVEKIIQIHTPKELEQIQKGLSCEKRKTTFRINTLKAHKNKTLENLEKT